MTVRSLAAFVVLSLALPVWAADGAFEKEVEIGQPSSAGGVTVFPLRPRAATDGSEYLVLDEAFAAGVLGVEEVGRGSVNTLLVTNRGTKPVYAMAGELLLGGKQDRIVGQSTIVRAGARRVPVPVYCVEHGRWNGRSSSFATGKALGHASLRKKALFEDQGGVWGEVGATNSALDTRNDSDTYRKAAEKLERETAQATRQLLRALDAVPDAAGLAVAFGGQVRAVETFAAPALFAKLREKLVASYVAESLRQGLTRPARPPTAGDVLSFMEEAQRAPRKRVKDGAASSAVDYDGAGVAGEQVHDKARSRRVHDSFFRK